MGSLLSYPGLGWIGSFFFSRRSHPFLSFYLIFVLLFASSSFSLSLVLLAFLSPMSYCWLVGWRGFIIFVVLCHVILFFVVIIFSSVFSFYFFTQKFVETPCQPAKENSHSRLDFICWNLVEVLHLYKIPFKVPWKPSNYHLASSTVRFGNWNQPKPIVNKMSRSDIHYCSDLTHADPKKA